MEKLTDEVYLYSIIIEPCEEGGYFAWCPLLQGCHAEGETYGETIDNLRDVIKAHIELRLKHGQPISSFRAKKPSDLTIQMPVPIGS